MSSLWTPGDEHPVDRGPGQVPTEDPGLTAEQERALADAATDKVLGCHIVGPQAGNLIAEVVLAMEFGAASEDIARTCHSHPTLTEAVRQAAMGVEGWMMQM